MTEVTVKVLVKAEVVEVDEVSPVEVSVDTEHLTEDGLADVNEVLWKATALANPIARTRELGQ